MSFKLKILSIDDCFFYPLMVALAIAFMSIVLFSASSNSNNIEAQMLELSIEEKRLQIELLKMQGVKHEN